MSKNAQLFERATQVIPGGVNSPVRAFGSVGGTPRFITQGKGAKIWDAEGTEYIDYIGSWGPAILGHADEDVIHAVQSAAAKGLSFGAPTELEIEIAELLVQRIPSIEMVRLVSSGTEATMSAIRLARGYTKRHKIIKFEGCYHGHADSLLVKAGSGLLTLGNPTSAGVPPEFVEHTLVLPYNDLEALEAAFKQYPEAIACVIVEPFAGNMNLIKPLPGYLEGMRKICTQYQSVLIFDEVMTGFRVGPRGVQGLLNITPDLTTLGKVIGGGMPVGAFGGKKEIMQCIAPLGPVYQAGTLSGNPVAVVAGLTTLKKIAAPGFYETIGAQCQRLADGIQDRAQSLGIPCTADHIGTMFGVYFMDTIPSSYQAVTQSNTKAFATFFHSLLNHGVYFAPSAYEAGFLSIAHTPEIIDQTLVAVTAALKEVQTQHY